MNHDDDKNTVPALPPFWYTLHRLTAVRRWLLHTAWQQSNDGRFLSVMPVEDAFYCPRVQMLEGYVGLQLSKGQPVPLSDALYYAGVTPCDCHDSVTVRRLHSIAHMVKSLKKADRKTRAKMGWYK